MFCKVCNTVKPNSKGGTRATTCTECVALGVKYCNSCCKVKPIEAFGTDTLGRPRSSCRSCQAKKSSAYKRIKYHNDSCYRVRRLEQNHERRSGIKNGYTVDEWYNKAAEYDFSCAYCGSTTNITCDHVVPLSKSGKTSIDNVVPACGTCNYSKGAKDLIEWYTSQPFFNKERLVKIIGGDYIAK